MASKSEKPARKNVNLPDDEALSDDQVRELENMLRMAEEIGNDVAEMRKDSQLDLLRLVEELAGSQFEEMMKGWQETLDFISDPDPKLRRAALILSNGYWQVSGSLRDTYETIAFTDPDYATRTEAIYIIGECFARTKDPHIGCRLAEVVRDERLPESLRVEAYEALRLLDGPTRSNAISLTSDEPLGGVNWGFVDRYREIN